MNEYADKNVVITGGSSGFGLVTAQLLVEGGARVMITGRQPETLAAAKEQLGDNAVAVAGDVADLDHLDTLAERAKAEFGTLDALFANAGITRFVPFEAVTEAVHDELFATNVKGAFFTVQKLAPLLREGGAVVLTTSVANVKGLEMISTYSATKAAVRSLTRGMARELLPRGIRVNAISPGPISTGILNKVLPEAAIGEVLEQMRVNNPMLRFGEPMEIAKAFAFLAFDATYTTGAELVVDGGATQL